MNISSAYYYKKRETRCAARTPAHITAFFSFVNGPRSIQHECLIKNLSICNMGICSRTALQRGDQLEIQYALDQKVLRQFIQISRSNGVESGAQILKVPRIHKTIMQQYIRHERHAALQKLLTASSSSV